MCFSARTFGLLIGFGGRLYWILLVCLICCSDGDRMGKNNNECGLENDDALQ
jgi:hypothetical protein